MKRQRVPLRCCRAGELSAQELEQLMVIVSNPRTFKVHSFTALSELHTAKAAGFKGLAVLLF